jgi:hypothetical protein
VLEPKKTDSEEFGVREEEIKRRVQGKSARDEE